jgi:hypothetical protein
VVKDFISIERSSSVVSLSEIVIILGLSCFEFILEVVQGLFEGSDAVVKFLVVGCHLRDNKENIGLVGPHKRDH